MEERSAAGGVILMLDGFHGIVLLADVLPNVLQRQPPSPEIIKTVQDWIDLCEIDKQQLRGGRSCK